MKLQTFVAVSALAFASLAPTFAAEPTVANDASGGIAISELSAQVNRLATDRFDDTTVSSFAKEHLAALWEHFSSDYPAIKSELASTVTSVWTKHRETADKSAQSLLTQDVLGRIWQTYHCLIVNRQPLSAEETSRSMKQIRRLAPMLDQLDDELLKRNPALPPEFLEGLLSEIARSLAHLNQHAASPAFPLLYRPLSEPDFEKVTTAIRADYQSRINQFIEGLPHTAASVEKGSRVKDKSSSQFLYENHWKHKGMAFAALAMGSIVRHYGLLGRNLDYTDQNIFPPFLKVNGAGLGYRMNDGVSMSLSIADNI
jgi:hypothetical protein